MRVAEAAMDQLRGICQHVIEIEGRVNAPADLRDQCQLFGAASEVTIKPRAFHGTRDIVCKRLQK